MLTRCKKGMVVVSSRAFLHKKNVQRTLLGKLCDHWETRHGVDATWRGWREVADGRVPLPGVATSDVGGPSGAGEAHEKVGKPPPQITALGRSLLAREMRERLSQRIRPMIHQANPYSGTAPTVRAPLLATTSSDSMPKALQVRNPLIDAARSMEFPSLCAPTAAKQSGGGWSGGSFAKAHLKPSFRVDDELREFQNLKLNFSVKQARQKALKGTRK